MKTEQFIMDDRREYDSPLECETCPTCGAQLTSDLACHRCDREKIDKRNGSVTIDESNQYKREWKSKREWRD